MSANNNDKGRCSIIIIMLILPRTLAIVNTPTCYTVGLESDTTGQSDYTQFLTRARTCGIIFADAKSYIKLNISVSLLN